MVIFGLSDLGKSLKLCTWEVKLLKVNWSFGFQVFLLLQPIPTQTTIETVYLMARVFEHLEVVLGVVVMTRLAHFVFTRRVLLNENGESPTMNIYLFLLRFHLQR